VAEAPAKKRRVKNPETFRQRAEKAAEAGQQPPKRHRVRKAAGRPFVFVFRPVGRAFKKLGQYQPFKFIGKVLHWVGLILWPRYFRNSWKEIRGVTWPSLKQSLRLTYAVLAFAVIFGASIALVDWGLDKVFKHILLK